MKIEFDEDGKQLGLPFYGIELNVDKMTDTTSPELIQYIGKARHVFDNTYRCLANVNGCLCVVEVSVRV